MSVIRIKKTHRKPYVILDTTALLDDRLSYRAKGLHTYLMTKPEDWQVHVDYLAQQSPTEGREAVRTALTELEDAGYVKRQKVRGERGLLGGWNTVVYETPALCTEDTLSEAPTTGLPKSVNPQSDTPPTTAQPKSVLPTSAKPQLVSMDLTQGLILEDPPSVSPPLGGDTELRNGCAAHEGNKNGKHRGNKIADALTLDEPQSVPDADPAAPVYVLTGDGTYAITTKSTRLSRHPAHQDRLYRAITEDATFADWYAAHGITGDLEQRWQDFVLRALDDNKRSGDWDVAFKRWLKGGPLETKRRRAPAEPRKKGDLAAYLRANKEEASA
jgi:hypothetical protein